jgi:hypothetical protein
VKLPKQVPQRATAGKLQLPNLPGVRDALAALAKLLRRAGPGVRLDLAIEVAERAERRDEPIAPESRAFVESQIGDHKAPLVPDDGPPWIEPAVELRGALDMIRMTLESRVPPGTLPRGAVYARPRDEAEAIVRGIKAMAEERDAFAQINPA